MPGPGAPADLAAALLSTMDGAPPSHLYRLLSRTGPTGPGTSTLRIPPAATVAPGLSTPDAAAGPGGAGRRGEPALFCPGPVRDDPALGAEVDSRVLAWAGQVGIYPGRLDRLRAAGIGRLIMLAHPACDDPELLTAAAKCAVAEWVADDYLVDEAALGADPETVGSRLGLLHAVVDPAPLPAGYAPALESYRLDDPIATAFRSAMLDLARFASTAQLARFSHQLSILFVAWSQEADWIRAGRMPAVWEYLAHRNMSSYLLPMLLVDVLAGYELPPREYSDPRVRRAFTTAGLASALLNDIHSGARESATDFNLPRVIAAEDGCPLRAATIRTVEIHNELMRAFVADAMALAAVGTPTLRRFLADTWAWLGGSREWHATTARYHSQGARS
jgi:2-methylisoborneol synthase